MVRGLERFREHFRAYADRYVLIGGTACDLVMNAVGLQFRATKDIDIVLCIDSFDTDFARAFWDFVKVGQYQTQESSDGKPRFYRFQKPSIEGYPTMLELFSRVPDALTLAEGTHLTPIPVDEEISSLSAILLDEDYYAWVQAGRRIIDGLSVVGPEHLIPLKARAWLDLRGRNIAGESVDSRDIKKHRNDVFRLFQIVDPEADVHPSAQVTTDMSEFLRLLPEESIDLKALGLRSSTIDEVVESLRQLYRTPE